MNAKLLTLSVAAGAAASVVALPAQAAPSFGSGIAQSPLLNQVQNRVFVYHGRPYCFYFDGWHGAGWYRCGWKWRHGLGWGGVYGWNDWEYARRSGGSATIIVGAPGAITATPIAAIGAVRAIPTAVAIGPRARAAFRCRVRPAAAKRRRA